MCSPTCNGTIATDSVVRTSSRRSKPPRTARIPCKLESRKNRTVYRRSDQIPHLSSKIRGQRSTIACRDDRAFWVPTHVPCRKKLCAQEAFSVSWRHQQHGSELFTSFNSFQVVN